MRTERKRMRTSHRTRLMTAAVALLGVAVSVAVVAPTAQAYPNPINPDGDVYAADAAPLVVGDKLYIYAGRDEAGPTTNDFIMNEWQAFVTDDIESWNWQREPNLMRPEGVFDWATSGRAYAGQVVTGVDGRYYWYVPVNDRNSTRSDKFAIGVAVSDTPLGPWTDAVGAPIVSQEILDNTAHNIDPTVLVDNGRVWMYWGSFSRLFVTELATDMTTRIGQPIEITSGVTGFFEGSWLFKRNDTYYLTYAANNAGPTSSCTPATYFACIAYSSAPSPTGPWTYQGVIMPPGSSTTAQASMFEFKGQWYTAYHNADAVGGNHFRRSIAVDKVEWDDSVSPARMLPVKTTPEKGPNLTPRSNVAPWATSSASNQPIPTQYWIKALNDEIIRPNPLPPDMWGSWSATRPPQQWIQYDWETPVRVDRARIKFWRDAAPGTGNGVSDPSSWLLQYWDAGEWKNVPNPSGYGTATTAVQQVTFDAVTTTRLRAVINASPNAATPPQYSAVAVEEWEVHAAQPASATPVSVETDIDVAPELPATVALQYPDGELAAPVRWNAVDPADYGAAGTFTVEGFVEGYAAGTVTATVTVRGENPWRTNLAPEGAPEAQATAAGSTLDALADGELVYTGDAAPRWTASVPDGSDTVWAGYTWDGAVRVDAVSAHFWSDREDAGDGVAVPEAWKVQALVDGAWTDVTGVDAYPTARTEPNTVAFDAVDATGIRVVLTAQSDGVTPADVGLGELEVLGSTIDRQAPEVELTTSGVQGAGGWFLGPVTVRATASDDRDLRARIEVAAGDGPWQATDNVRFVDTTVQAEGESTVRARATDGEGNTSAEATTTVRIDRTAPTVAGTLDIDARTVTAAAADAGSGVAQVEYAIDAPIGWQAYSGPVVVDEQRRTVFLRAKDAAGNVSTNTSVVVPLSPDAPLSGNIAPLATPTASYTSSWNSVTAVNDGARTGASWGTWPNVGEQWVQLEWDRVVTVDRAAVQFFRDSADTANVGMIPPRTWRLQYVDLATGQWKDVETADAYGRSSTELNPVTFAAVKTTKLRALMQAWGAASAGGSSGILEFEAWAAEPVAPAIELEVTVTGRCVAGKATLVVSSENGSEVPVAVRLETPYGAKSIEGIEPGRRTSQAFSSRLKELPAGSVAATATAEIDGSTVTEEYSIPFDARTC